MSHDDIMYKTSDAVGKYDTDGEDQQHDHSKLLESHTKHETYSNKLDSSQANNMQVALITSTSKEKLPTIPP